MFPPACNLVDAAVEQHTRPPPPAFLSASSHVPPTFPQVPEVDEVFPAYHLAHASIEQFIHNTHSEWFNTIESGIEKVGRSAQSGVL